MGVLLLQLMLESDEKFCYTDENHVEAQQIVADRIFDCSFLAEDKFRNIHSLILVDCCNVDGGLLADIVLFLNELKHLNLRNSSVSQYNILTISKRALQLTFLDANCDQFVAAIGYTVVSNIKTLQQFDCDVLFPAAELRDWKRIVAIFGLRIKFGRQIQQRIRFWSQRAEALSALNINYAVEQ